VISAGTLVPRRRRPAARGREGSVPIGSVEVVLRAGVTKTEALRDLDLPFDATFGANLRF
jgi:hypothetical protein